MKKRKMSFFSRINELDRVLTLKLRAQSNEKFETFLRGVALFERGRPWLVAFVIIYVLSLFWFPLAQEIHVFFRASLAPVLAWLISTVLKKLIQRPRPFQSLSIHPPLVINRYNDSMPSSHAATLIAFIHSIHLAGFFFAPVLFLWGLLVIFSRVYFGAHYFSDVIVGALVGISSSLMIQYFFFHTFL